ncbi:MAG: beta-N-acetylhexosaminidase [Fimbriimonadaceae bacterium]
MCPILPLPAHFTALSGSFRLDASTQIIVTPQTKQIGDQLQNRVRTATGLNLKLTTSGEGKRISLRIAPDLSRLGDEGYRLEVGEDGVIIQAPKAAGVFYGVQSLLQLFPPAIFAGSRSKADWSAQACLVEDYPRFKWRGGHLDVGRHFMPSNDVKRFIDLLAMHKMNTFHWHLTEDQGWRIEIKKYPKLTEIGSKRTNTMTNYSPATYTGKPHEGFYTQDQVREIVKYASDRFVTVVPEIEMPGHATAAIAAYPELGNTGRQLPVATTWGVIESVLNTEPSTIKFMQDVLDEVIQLFPGQFIHIGGDECPKKEWKESKSAQDRMSTLGLKSEHELQSWFIRQMDQHLTSKGRRLIGWSEILEGGLAPGAGLRVWLGNEGAMEAVRSGHDVVMAQTTHTYLDFYQSRDTAQEPKAIGGFLPLDRVYGYEPILPEMSREQASHVLGCQFQIWTEYIPDFKKVEYMAYPRACALSEVAWSQRSDRDYDDFTKRLTPHLARLEALGVNFRKPR